MTIDDLNDWDTTACIDYQCLFPSFEPPHSPQVYPFNSSYVINPTPESNYEALFPGPTLVSTTASEYQEEMGYMLRLG